MWDDIQTGQLVHMPVGDVIVETCWLLTSDFGFDFGLIVNDRNGMEGLDCEIDAQWVDSGWADVV